MHSLTVIPRFLGRLEDQYVREESDAKFTCEVYPPRSDVNWVVNDKVISNSKKYRLTSSDGERCLVIKDTLEEDQGAVKAFVEEDSTQAALSVEGIMPQSCHLNL